MIKKTPLPFGDAAFFCSGVILAPATELVRPIFFGHDLPPDSQASLVIPLNHPDRS
jgi:hypothetical protein